ncbi:chromosome partitioning protein ParB [Brevibacillus laterosporus]|uniref:Chromosome partitioning protein ParB n=1 Tax=Brevibacillus laterosporus TaxID=1465 RepID=A0A518V4Y3_BRELA|nr:chromosome partitioning protein ParB [Brevibacillus laterosporus]
MDIRLLPIDKINPAPYNPRVDLQPGDAEYEKLKRSIEDFGYVEPLVWNQRTGNLVGGHQRYKILVNEQGRREVEVSVVDLDEQKEKALNIAMNKISGDWDEEKLSLLIEELAASDFNMELTGFDSEEIDELLKDYSNDYTDLSNDLDSSEGERKTLFDKFLIPPFSVLDTRQGYWQDRKRQWLSLGMESKEGRDSNLIYNLGNQSEYMRKAMEQCGGGTSIFDPVLCELIYRWFCPNSGQILDPFAGGSVRGVVASYLGYQYTGIDLRPEQIESNIKQANEMITRGILQEVPEWIVGDSRNINQLVEQAKADLIFSCPPYADLEVYSDNPADISNMNYDDFLRSYREIILNAVSMLKDNRFACFVVGDIRDRKGIYRNFVSHTIQAFIDAGMQYYNEGILINVVGTVALRAGRQFAASRKLGKCHQNVLVFYKGNPRDITSELGSVDIEDSLLEKLA